MEELWGQTKVFLARMARFKRRKRIKRYGFPILLVGLVFLLKTYYGNFLGDNSAFLFVSFVVAVSSWYGGLGPGIFATILSGILTYRFFLLADISSHPIWGDFTVLTIFFIEGLMISIVSEARFQMEDKKDEFIGFVAHELKNPLAALKGFSSLLTMHAIKNKDEKAVVYGQKITFQADKILELTNDLLDITKMEVGRLTYSDSSFNMKDVVKESIFHQQLIVKNRLIEFHGTSNHFIYADKYRIGQVITNLLTNALKYSPESKKILVTLKDTPRGILLTVRDYGIGIGESDQKKIFDRFYRAGGVERSSSDGLGLGLYISSQIVNRHNGKLWVRSKAGKGTTFYLALPFNRAINRALLTGIIA